MPEEPVEALLSPPGAISVRILRWWWVDQASGHWAADISVTGHGLVAGVPGSWLERSGQPSPVVPKNRRGRVVHERREGLGERFGADRRPQGT